MTQPTGANPPPAGIDAPGASASARELLTFTLGTEHYALEILAPEQIKPAPKLGAGFDTRYLTGLGTVDEHMLILVDIEKLLTSEELALAGALVQ